MNNLNISSGFTIFGFEIKYYGLIMAFSYILALVVCIILCRKKHYNENLPYKLLLIAFPLAVIGGRLGYVIGDILKNGTTWTFLEVIDIRSGGLMVYGGIILSAIGFIVYAFVKNKNVFQYFDLIAPCLIIGQALGRIGCLFEGCCHGIEITNPSLMWFPFAQKIGESWYLATQLFESILCLAGFFVIYNVYKKTRVKGLSTSLYLLIYGVIRIFTESFRAEEQCLMANGIRISRLISIVVATFGLIYLIILLVKINKEKKLALQKHNESNLFAQTAEEIENKVYTKDDFMAPQSDNPLLNSNNSVLNKVETSGNPRVEKIKQADKEKKLKEEQKAQKKKKGKKK